MSGMVGQWARRIHLSSKGASLIRPVTSWHLVESQIQDRLVTRCGREMKAKRDLPFEFTTTLGESERACYWCVG